MNRCVASIHLGPELRRGVAELDGNKVLSIEEKPAKPKKEKKAKAKSE